MDFIATGSSGRSSRSVFARADSDRGEPPPEEARQVADDAARAPP